MKSLALPDRKPSSRRQFLRDGSITAGLLGVSPALVFGQGAPVNGSIKVGTEHGVVVPADFLGLSYENMQLEDPLFFSTSNAGLVKEFKAISPRGVLRLGGNTSEFGWWQARPDDVAPKRVDSPWKAAGEPTAATVFAITPQAIDNLNGFLLATGWTCIYGLNLGYGSPATDVPEALYVANKLGPRLQYFQVGNEVDLFKGHLRDPATWNPRSYLEEWLAIARAVQKAIPTARFGMPDVAGEISWLPKVADLLAPMSGKPAVVTLSHHYYWSGPPSNPAANITNLLKIDPKVASFAATASGAAKTLGPGVTWRMTEGNTVYRGGKYGVSDVFAAALWAADYLFQLMSLGYCGVNLHGGSGHAQAVSVGGVFHGEALMKDPTAPHPKPFYTPIANEGTLAGAGVDGKLNGNYVLEPVGYGMKFAAQFAGATLLPIDFKPGPVNATAYAGLRGGSRLIAILNKDASQSLTLPMPACRVISKLSAPMLDSREADFSRPAETREAGAMTIPPFTAVLVELR